MAPHIAPPKSDGEVEVARKNAVPSNTARNTNWAVKVWREWRTNHFQYCNSTLDCPPHLCSNSELDYWLSKFVLETPRLDGQPYPPRTLYGIVCSIMWYVRELHPHQLFQGCYLHWFSKNAGWRNETVTFTGIGSKAKKSRTYLGERREYTVGKRSTWEPLPPGASAHNCVFVRIKFRS